MKKILIGFIAIGLLTFFESCQQSSNKTENDKNLYKELIESELKTGVNNDTIILGYIFGMSPKQVKEHTIKLLKEEKINQVDGDLIFELKISDKLFTFTYNTKFYNDKLNFFRAEAKDLRAVELNNSLKESYGNYQFVFKDNLGAIQTTDYCWISGNREIKSVQISGAYSKNVLIFEDQSNQELIDASKTISDLENNSNNARVMVWKFVKEKLKNPSSSKFGRFRPKKTQSGSWVSKSYVDSQNSFGATIRTNFNCEVKYSPKSKSWELIGLKTY